MVRLEKNLKDFLLNYLLEKNDSGLRNIFGLFYDYINIL